eukprot:GHVL01044346.1.p1 GENE.GHVL01044346.1~~GHVL01044346.1.p1  ORF type:complete len:227 (-),score=29.55 GHVL01044346.1:239-919(-)
MKASHERSRGQLVDAGDDENSFYHHHLETEISQVSMTASSARLRRPSNSLASSLPLRHMMMTHVHSEKLMPAKNSVVNKDVTTSGSTSRFKDMLLQRGTGHTHQTDPPKDAHFTFTANGEIETVSFPGESGPLICRYYLVFGSDWTMSSGVCQAISQTAMSDSDSLGTDRGDIVFNFPFSNAWKGHNVSGWPRILLEIDGFDWRNRLLKDTVPYIFRCKMEGTKEL